MSSYQKIARYLDAKREGDVLDLQVIRLQKRGHRAAMAAWSQRWDAERTRARRCCRRAYAALTADERIHVERILWAPVRRTELDRLQSSLDGRTVSGEQAQQLNADIRFEDEGPVTLVWPLSGLGRAWIEDCIEYEAWQRIGPAVIIDARFRESLVLDARRAGLEVA